MICLSTSYAMDSGWNGSLKEGNMPYISDTWVCAGLGWGEGGMVGGVAN